MPEWIKWAFDGIGTEIISLFFGLIIGGISGYAIGKNTKSTQTQSAGNNAKQKQVFTVDNGSDNSKKYMENNTIQQAQTAGDNAVQTQIGGVKHGK